VGRVLISEKKKQAKAESPGNVRRERRRWGMYIESGVGVNGHEKRGARESQRRTGQSMSFSKEEKRGRKGKDTASWLTR